MKSALPLTTAFLLLLAGAAGAQTLTVSWWGYNGEKLDANLIQPFKAQCGCDVQFETGNNADRLNKLRARRGAGVDVIFLTDAYSQIGIKEGIFQEIDRSKIPNIGKLYEIAQAPQGEYGPAYTIGRIGIAYDAEAIDPPISSWNDLWREDLEGRVTLPGITTTAGPMIVLQAGEHAGVDAYADPDAAFAAVEQLVPNSVKNYNTGSEMVNLISTGEASLAVTQDFTLASLQEAVPSMTWADLEEGDIAVLNTVNIPTGSENVELADQFIDFLLSTEVQQAQAEQGVDAPVNAEVTLTPEQAALWTYGNEMIGSLKRLDYEALNAAKGDWIDRWNSLFGM